MSKITNHKAKIFFATIKIASNYNKANTLKNTTFFVCELVTIKEKLYNIPYCKKPSS